MGLFERFVLDTTTFILRKNSEKAKENWQNVELNAWFYCRDAILFKFGCNLFSSSSLRFFGILLSLETCAELEFWEFF